LQAKLHIHIITKKQINLYRKFSLYETQNTKKQTEPKIVRTDDYNCAYVLIMAVLTPVLWSGQFCFLVLI